MTSADWTRALHDLPAATRAQVKVDEPMLHHTTLRVGGPADLFIRAFDRETLASIAVLAHRHRLPVTLIGDGSNVCIGDSGLRGLTVRNSCSEAVVGALTRVDCGHSFMRLFQKTMWAGLSGLEFAVGIPGTVGGALVSNAGAYRANICDLVRRIEVVEQGERLLVGPEWMEFSYRDSRLRRDDSRPATLLGVELELRPDSKRAIRLRARDFQNQRICKQPWEPSAGSWFKNVYDALLAQQLPTLPSSMREAGVVPAGYLTEACGLKGFGIGGAMISPRHGNFIVNRGSATAQNLRDVAAVAQQRVFERFGVSLEREVLYLGD